MLSHALRRATGLRRACDTKKESDNEIQTDSFGLPPGLVSPLRRTWFIGRPPTRMKRRSFNLAAMASAGSSAFVPYFLNAVNSQLGK
jgi:hypothetical protein